MRIVDLHTWKGPCIYVGRQMFRRKGSPLGNPYKPKDHGANTLSLYRNWLCHMIEMGDAAVMQAFKEIHADSVLGCWCVNLEGDDVFTKPEVCHAQVIAEAWQYVVSLRSDGNGSL